MANIKKVLIVCTGNACRSPMAEGFLKKELRPADGFEVISAGTSAMDGFSATADAVEVMREENIDISHHTTRRLSKELINKANIVLVMAGMHKDFIEKTVPESSGKVYLYKEFASAEGDKDIPDPIGQDIGLYRVIRDEIKKATNGIVRRIKEA